MEDAPDFDPAVGVVYPGRDAVFAAGPMATAVLQKTPNNASSTVAYTGAGSVNGERADGVRRSRRHWVSQAIYVAAKLGIADHLANGPIGVGDLAAVTHSDASSLQRVLRALASVGVFTETAPGQYGLTSIAALLQTGTPDSMRSLAIVYGDELYRAWADFLHSVQTGQPAFEHHFGMGPFTYYAQHPNAGHIFNEAMIGYTNAVAGAVAAIYDFSPFTTVVDVGGGYGALLASILQQNRTQRGILFDQPHVVANAESFLASAGVADRCTRVGGDFFEAVPSLNYSLTD